MKNDIFSVPYEQAVKQISSFVVSQFRMNKDYYLNNDLIIPIGLTNRIKFISNLNIKVSFIDSTNDGVVNIYIPDNYEIIDGKLNECVIDICAYYCDKDDKDILCNSIEKTLRYLLHKVCKFIKDNKVQLNDLDKEILIKIKNEEENNLREYLSENDGYIIMD